MLSYKIFDPDLVGDEISEELYGQYVSLREWFILMRENIATIEQFRHIRCGNNQLSTTPARLGLYDRVCKVAGNKSLDRHPLYKALNLHIQPRQYYGEPENLVDESMFYINIEKLQVAREYYRTKVEFIEPKGFINPYWFDCLVIFNAYYRRNEPLDHIYISY